MAEPAKPRRASVRTPDEEDTLAAINDHLGRFLRHADELLDEWARFGGEVRARVGGEVERVGVAVEQAVDGAVDRVAGRTADRVADEVAGRLVARLADVGGELDRVTRAARRASSAAAEIQGERHRASRWIAAALGAAVLADVLLVLLLMRGERTAPSPPPRTPGLAAACDELSRGWSDPAFAVVRAAGVEACGALAGTVDAVIVARFAEPEGEPVAPVDAGVAPASVPAPDAGTSTGSGSAKTTPRVTPAPARHRKGR